MIKLSIGIPTYNRAAFLIATLESILPQMREGMEIVISDNGSTDDTLKRLESYQTQSSIRVVGFKSNQGIDRNIVNVIENSLGEYVHLFGDDDLLMPGSIDKIFEEINRTDPVLLCLNHFAFHNHSLSERQPPFLSLKRKHFKSGSAFFKYCGLGFISSLIFKREEALKLSGHVRFGKECAHLDIVSRMALQQRGTYVYMGDVVVAGRSLKKPRYDLMRSCVFYPKELYDELLVERLLSKSLYQFFINKLFYKEVPRILYKLMKGSDHAAAMECVKLHTHELPWPLRALIHLNKQIVTFTFDCVFLFIKMFRKVKLLITS